MDDRGATKLVVTLLVAALCAGSVLGAWAPTKADGLSSSDGCQCGGEVKYPLSAGDSFSLCTQGCGDDSCGVGGCSCSFTPSDHSTDQQTPAVLVRLSSNQRTEPSSPTDTSLSPLLSDSEDIEHSQSMWIWLVFGRDFIYDLHLPPSCGNRAPPV